MLNEFKNWLLNRNYKPSTALDYQGRIERLCRKEAITLLPEYEIAGAKSSYGKRSHTSVRQALRNFKMFVSMVSLQESAN